MPKLKFIMLFSVMSLVLIACDSGNQHPLKLTQRILASEGLTVGYPDCWIDIGSTGMRIFLSDNNVQPNASTLASGQVVMIFRQSDIPPGISNIGFETLQAIARQEATDSSISSTEQMTTLEQWLDEVMTYSLSGNVQNLFGSYGAYIITGYDTIQQKLFTAIALTASGEEQAVSETVKAMMTSLQPATGDALLVQAPLPDRCTSGSMDNGLG